MKSLVTIIENKKKKQHKALTPVEMLRIQIYDTNPF